MKYIARFLLILLTALSISSCSGHLGLFHYTHAQAYTGEPQKVIPVYIDVSFGNFDRIELNRALERWNYSLNGHIKFSVIEDYYTVPTDIHEGTQDGNGLLIMKITAENPPIPIPKDTPNAYAYCDDYAGHRIYLIRERFYNYQIYGITLHELGHILGAHHIKDNTSLMYKYYGEERNECIDYGTIKEIAEFNHIPVSDLNYYIKE